MEVREITTHEHAFLEHTLFSTVSNGLILYSTVCFVDSSLSLELACSYVRLDRDDQPSTITIINGIQRACMRSLNFLFFNAYTMHESIKGYFSSACPKARTHTNANK